MDPAAGDGRAEARRSDVLAFLCGIPLIQQLPAAAVEQIADCMDVVRYRPGELLAREGTRGDGLYVVWKGQAEVPPGGTQHGLERTRLTIREGDYFGQACTDPNGGLHRADVIATTDVTCFILRHEHSHLLAAASSWRLESPPEEQVAVVERILQLEKLEIGLFRGHTPPEGNLYPRVFGGQLLGQALAAACKSVNPSLLVHSLQAYFLVAGDTLPIIYRVERIRDGNSFATRYVVAIQKGKNIFSMHASFQKTEDGFEHQIPMPSSVPLPQDVLPWDKLQGVPIWSIKMINDLVSFKVLAEESYNTDSRIPSHVRRKFAKKKRPLMPIDMRFISPVDRVDPGKRDPRQLIWIRARGKLSSDQALQRCVLAYASDFSFLETALLPHGVASPNPRLIESPRSSGSRGFCLGRMYSQTGELVASVAQEGLIRLPNLGKPGSTATVRTPPTVSLPAGDTSLATPSDQPRSRL
eukprot:SM000359S13452  [mRNA]  locus=s359:43045:45979:+ [translate_table: standard]